MRTGPWPALNEGRSASPPAQSFPVVASMVFAALGSQRPIAPKVMGYLGDRLRHSERARPPHPDRSRPPSGVLLRPAMFRSFRCADRLRPIPPGDRQVSANFRPELWPAVEGGGKGRKSGFRHVLMLWRKILSMIGVALPATARKWAVVLRMFIPAQGFSVGLNVGVFGSRWTVSQARLIDRES